MTKRFLRSTTTVVTALSMAMPLPVLAQGEGGGGLPICVNAEGKPWAELPFGEAPQAAAAGTGDGAGQAMAQCVIRENGKPIIFEGFVTDAGEVAVTRRALLAAMVNMGLISAAEAQPAPPADQATDQATEQATEQATDQTAPSTPEPVVEAAEPDAEPEAGQETAAQTPEPEPETKPKNDAETATVDSQTAAPIVEGARTIVADDSAAAEPEPKPKKAEEIEVRQDDTAASTEAANTAPETQAAASADATAAADEVEVEVETVTEADTRSSDEDFSTAANAKAGAKKDGLSNFEKFAIGAIGAVAVGALLSNGNKVVSNSGDRVVVQRQDGEYEVLKDDNVLLRRPGVEVRTERFRDGSTRETMLRENGGKVITIKAANGQVLRRVRVRPDGTQVVLFDDTLEVEPVTISELPRPRRAAAASGDVSADELRLALAANDPARFERRYSLQQIRQIRAVRELVPEIELEAVTFDTGSAAIRASEAEDLRDLGVAMARLIERNPYEVFLVEGHTDAVGSATYNLALSDRRAESVALALTEYFDVPPENMVVQGYGESNLKIRTPFAERENRRATVRRITPLLRTASLQ